MAIHTAVVRLVNINSDGTIFYKSRATINQIMNGAAGSEHRVFEAESGSAPNAASDGAITAPTIHEYLVAEDGDSYSIVYMDQYYIITQQ